MQAGVRCRAKPAGALTRRLCACLHAARREVERMHAGKPTLRPWEEVAGKEIGVS